jgi:hypothetical protein
MEAAMHATKEPVRNSSSRNINKKWPEPLGRPPSIENRHPSELEIDDSYQRSTTTMSSTMLIRKIARNWDWRMCLPLVVSRRENGFYVIDGQHRLAAARLRDDIRYLPCCISTYGSIVDEAAMFVAMNRTRKAIGQLDDFHASVASGDVDAMAIERLVLGADLAVSRATRSQSWAPGEVSFTSSIVKVRRKHGDQVCSNALELIAAAFPGQILKAGASVFRALAQLEISGATPDRQRLLQALRKHTQLEWASYVTDVPKDVEGRGHMMAEAILAIYGEVAPQVCMS